MTVLLAYTIAQDAHKGQVDKAGNNYMYHLCRVAEMFHGDSTLESAALLHDVFEDTSITDKDLRRYGVSSKVIDIVHVLTRGELETYNDYIHRVSKHSDAKMIKIQDIVDHLCNVDVLSDSMIERYTKALSVLNGIRKVE